MGSESEIFELKKIKLKIQILRTISAKSQWQKNCGGGGKKFVKYILFQVRTSLNL